MVAVNSTMLALGTEAPSFTLTDTISGETMSLESMEGEKGYMVMFICNHCPYVKLIFKKLVEVCSEFQKNGVKVIAISSNDQNAYPEDSPEKMKTTADDLKFTFPYLFDRDQSIAKAYKAACTPDFFLFNGDKKLVYRGQFDGARPGNDVKPSGESLKEAVDAMLLGNSIAEEKQVASIGCNIKWVPGNEPEYFN